MSTINAREQALKILYRVDTQKSYATQLLDQVSKDNTLADRDRALIHQLVKGTLEWRGKIDFILERLVKHGTKGLTPWILNILRLGAYQILFLDRIPPEVAVNEAVNLAKKYGHQGTIRLVNAVLRKVATQSQTLLSSIVEEDPVDYVATNYSHPKWMVQRWIQQIGINETIALCAANNEPWPLCIRTNTLKISTTDLRQLLKADNIAWQPACYEPDCTIIADLPPNLRIHTLKAYHDGLFQVQDESFAIISRLVDPQPGEYIVDLCSAPGGKTTHLAERMHNHGRIAAVDRHLHRLALVRENCKRLGVTIVEEVCADGRTIQLDHLADRVLVDAPCSGTGVLGRRSDARWNKSEDDLPRLRQLQLELLLHAATLVRPGGCLIYTTCAIDAEENDGTVEAFLGNCAEFTRIEVSGHIPPELVDEKGYYRTWPHRHGMGGAFGAVMVKRSV